MWRTNYSLMEASASCPTPMDPFPTLSHTLGTGSAVPLSLTVGERFGGRILQVDRYPPHCLKCWWTRLKFEVDIHAT
jgi:hypothetical protein